MTKCERCGFEAKTHLYVYVRCEMCERPVCLDCWQFIKDEYHPGIEYKVCKTCLKTQENVIDR